MSAEAAAARRDRRWIWILTGAGLALVIGANWHLVYVAVTSQPECVPHVRRGAEHPAGGFSAAELSCTPR